MRTALTFLIALFMISTVYSQVGKEFETHTPRMIAYGKLPDDEKGEDVQRNFITQNWRTGTVYFRNMTAKVEVPIIFDLYSNRLYFLKDNSIMEFSHPVKEFTIGIIAGTQNVNLLYRNGYPVIHKNMDETFYEVLVDGKFQLLKCKAKTIGLYKDTELPEEERFHTKELLYAFLPNGKMILVKKDKEHLLNEIAEYADTVQKICADEKLKLKNEAQLRTLFVELNKREPS
jgi:hypothetical protein